MSLPQRLNEIISMESQLICDGTLILKFFLHISQQEQYDRLQASWKRKNPPPGWWTAHDHEQNRRYDEYMKGMDDLMSITNLKGAPWHVLDAADLEGCERQMYEIVIRAFEDALAKAAAKPASPGTCRCCPTFPPFRRLGFPPLSPIDLNKTAGRSLRDGA